MPRFLPAFLRTHLIKIFSLLLKISALLIRLQDQMDTQGTILQAAAEPISETFDREKDRLLGFIRSRVRDVEEAEDILQDVFYQFVYHYDAIESLDAVTSWLYTVARNKITDSYRKKKPDTFSRMAGAGEERALSLLDILPDFSSMPDEVLAREMILEALEEALEELPETQREVFVRHEFDQQSFKDMAVELGVGVNTLLSRKRYAVLHLRDRLRELYQEL